MDWASRAKTFLCVSAAPPHVWGVMVRCVDARLTALLTNGVMCTVSDCTTTPPEAKVGASFGKNRGCEQL